MGIEHKEDQRKRERERAEQPGGRQWRGQKLRNEARKFGETEKIDKSDVSSVNWTGDEWHWSYVPLSCRDF